MSKSQQGTTGSELVPLAERLNYMLGFRATAVVAVLSLALAVPGMVSADVNWLALATAGYGAVSLLGFGVWRILKGRGLFLFGALLIVDGIYLAAIAYMTGGTTGPLQFLILIHIATVALLASYRTSMKLALWHSLLALVVYYAEQSEILATPQSALQLPGTELERLVLFMASFWLVAVATAAFSAVNERELRRRRYDLEALARLAGELEEARNSVTVGEVLLRRLDDAFDFLRMILIELPAEASPTMLAWRGTDEYGLGALDVRPGSVLHEAATQRRTLLVSRADAESDRVLAEAMPDARNLVLVPLSAEGRSIGLLVIEHGMRRGSRIERRVVSMVERFTSHAALGLRNAWLLEEVQERAATDGLTGIANRRTLEATLDRELARATREGDPLSLVMLDLDHFKQLNDEHGHQAGDAVLREVAGVLRDHCREFDVPARYGGEEFAVVLPGCDMEQSLEIAERLRRSISEADTTVAVTTSAGVATFPNHGDDVVELIKAADDALYESKDAGRDRVTRSRRHLTGMPAASVYRLDAPDQTADGAPRRAAH